MTEATDKLDTLYSFIWTLPEIRISAQPPTDINNFHVKEEQRINSSVYLATIVHKHYANFSVNLEMTK